MSEIDIRNEPGLFRVTTESKTVYYVDTRDILPVVLRHNNGGLTVETQFDGQWAYLWDLISIPIILTDEGLEISAGPATHWALATGARHIYVMTAMGDTSSQRRIMQRECLHIDRIDHMPDGLPAAINVEEETS